VGCAASARLEATGGQIIGVAVEEVEADGQNLRAGAFSLPAVPAAPTLVPPTPTAIPPTPTPPITRWSIYLPFADSSRRAPSVASAHAAASVADAIDWQLNLPSLRRAVPEGAGAALLTSELTVMSMAAETSTLHVSFFDPNGVAIPCDDCTATLGPWGAHRWWLGDITTWPTGTVSSAMIASPQPLAATVADLPLRDVWDETLYAEASTHQQASNTSPAAAITNFPRLDKIARVSAAQSGWPNLPLLVMEYRASASPAAVSPRQGRYLTRECDEFGDGEG
jgi:hypothetical protein